MKPAQRFFWFKPLKDHFENEKQEQAVGFVWSCRYSSTDEPDKQGRWARVCHYRGYLIGWVSRIENKDKIIYTRNDYFPTSGNDMPYKSEVVKTLEEAKNGIERGFREFLERCR